MHSSVFGAFKALEQLAVVGLFFVAQGEAATISIRSRLLRLFSSHLTQVTKSSKERVRSDLKRLKNGASVVGSEGGKGGGGLRREVIVKTTAQCLQNTQLFVNKPVGSVNICKPCTYAKLAVCLDFVLEFA